MPTHTSRDAAGSRFVSRPVRAALRRQQLAASLIAAVKERALPAVAAGLVRHAFRSTEPSAAGDMCDDAFRALRMLHHVEEWVNTSARYTAASLPLKFSLLTVAALLSARRQ